MSNQILKLRLFSGVVLILCFIQSGCIGTADRGLVMFSSDNGSYTEGGYHYSMHNSNAPLRGGKRDLYEGGIRVPLIARWPGKIAPDCVGYT